MSVTCIHCQKWDLRKTDKVLGKLGFAVCKVLSLSAGHTYSGTYPRDCEHFTAAANDVVAARKTYLGEKE